MSNPTFSATNASNITSITVNESHGQASAMALIECGSFSGDIGDTMEVYAGYDGVNTRKFSGYVKEVHRMIPENTYTVMAYDAMVRASDYTLVASNPDTPFSRQNILMENLVRDLMAEAGLTNFTTGGVTTYFTFAVNQPIEIDVVSVFDYCNNIARLMNWSIWADQNGQIHFQNRKPYVMTGTSGEIGDVADVPTGFVVSESNSINIASTRDEKNLRNRVVIRGQGVTGEASASSPYLPAGFYKTAVLGAPQLIDDADMAQEVAEINLNSFNHIEEVVEATVFGDEDLAARQVVQVNSSVLSITAYFYIMSCTTSITKQGFLSSLTLRRII